MEVSEAGDPLEALMAGTVRSVEFSGGQVVLDAPRAGLVYLPGSFNPLHDGHKCEVAPSPAAATRKSLNSNQACPFYVVNEVIVFLPSIISAPFVNSSHTSRVRNLAKLGRE